MPLIQGIVPFLEIDVRARPAGVATARRYSCAKNTPYPNELFLTLAALSFLLGAR